MTRPRMAATVALFVADAALGLVLLDTLERVGWPTLAALLRHHGLAG